MLLSVVGAPPQDADCGGRDAPKLYLGFTSAMGKSELIPSVVPTLLGTSHRRPKTPDLSDDEHVVLVARGA